MLAQVGMKVQVKIKAVGKSGVVSFPIPSDYSGQTLIGIRVQTEPTTALVSWKCSTRPDGLNRLLHATIESKGGDVTVSYAAEMLVPGYEVIRNQQKEFGNWLGATTSIESDAPEILKVLGELREGKPSPDEFASRVVRWVAKNQFEKLGVTNGSDALTTLKNGGDSLGRANLCAAIFRAAKIPARVVSHVANWSERTGAEYWLTQYQSDEGVWVMAQPISGIAHPVRNSVVVLSIASRRDESHIANPSALRPDAPTYSTPEISSELSWASAKEVTPHATIQIFRTFPRNSGARLMPAAARRSDAVYADAKKGKSDWLEETLLRRILRKGPINLALYLDGQPTMPGG
jgi:hypothetical protein